MARPWLRHLWAWGPAVILLAAIFCETAIDHPYFMVGPLAGQDEPGHFAAYALLCVLLWRALRFSYRPWVFNWAPVLALVLSSLCGALDEYHKLFVPGRAGEVRDWAIDTLGALTAAVALLVYGELRKWAAAQRPE